MDPKEAATLPGQVYAAESGSDNRLDLCLSRRTFIVGATASALAIGSEKFVLAQNPEGTHKPSPSDGPPECDGTCAVFPFILIARDEQDTGVRSKNPNDHSLGPPSPNIWFEDPITGQHFDTLTPGQQYLIGVTVKNLGSGPTYTLCVDFMIWTSTQTQGGNTVHNYDIVSVSQGLSLMQGQDVTVKSRIWSPTAGMGLKPGDAIVRAYDPWSDHYTETGVQLFVNQDRHLAHKSYT
jgi:hypothetical protein